jgi:cell division protein FtsB
MSSDALPLGDLTLTNAGAIGPLDEVEQKLDQVKEKASEVGESGLGGLIERFESLTIAGQGIEDIVSKVEQLGHALIEAAVEAERHERAMAALGDTADRVASATNDVVEAEDAWQAQQRLTQAGLHVTGEQLAAITMRAREYAVQTGTDTPAALEQLTSALLSGAERGLRPFGLNVGDAHDRTAAFSSALQQLEHRASETSPSARTLGEDVHRVSNNLHDAIASAAGWIAEMSGFQGIISGIGDALGGLTERAEDATAALDRARQHAQQATAAASTSVHAQQNTYIHEAMQRAGVSDLGSLLDPSQQAEIAGLSERLGLGSNVSLGRFSDDQRERIVEILAARRGDRLGDHAARGENANELYDIIRSSLDEAAQQQANQSVTDRETAVHDRMNRLRSGQRDQALDREARQRLGIHGTSHGAAHHHAGLKDEESDETTKRAQEEEEASRRLTEELERQKNKTTELQEAETAEHEAALAGERSKLQAANELTLAYEHQHDVRVQLSEAAVRMFHLEQTSAQAAAERVESLTNAIGASAQKHLLAVVKNQETFGQALGAMGQDIAEAAFKEAVIGAGLEAAKAIGSAASGDYPGAAEHTAAVAAYGAVAALTGGALAATSSSAPQAVPPSSSSRMNTGAAGSPHDYDSQGMGGAKLEINLTVGGNIYSGEHAEDEVFALVHGAVKRGADVLGLRRG